VAVIDTGIDYTHPDRAANYAGGIDYVTPDGDPMDDHGHGTHVSGTIAAAMNNPTGDPAGDEGVVGVAPFARIRAYKVCDANGTCSDFAIQQAIVQAVADGAKVINMSLGGAERSQGLDDAVQFAWNAGLVIVAGLEPRPHAGRRVLPDGHECGHRTGDRGRESHPPGSVFWNLYYRSSDH
jgi:subtilisin family serine protease